MALDSKKILTAEDAEVRRENPTTTATDDAGARRSSASSAVSLSSLAG